MALRCFLQMAAKMHGLELDSGVLETMSLGVADWLQSEQARTAIGQGMLVQGGLIVRNVADSLGVAAKASS